MKSIIADSLDFINLLMYLKFSFGILKYARKFYTTTNTK